MVFGRFFKMRGPARHQANEGIMSEKPDISEILKHLPKAYFTEENSAEVVTGQSVNAKNKRLQEVMESITNHLHAAIKEIEPTQEEWMQAIQFLTATGHKCDDWRQEFILLSDVLGVSMLVDAINSKLVQATNAVAAKPA